VHSNCEGITERRRLKNEALRFAGYIQVVMRIVRSECTANSRCLLSAQTCQETTKASINNLLDEKVLPLFIVAYSSSRMQSFVETEELSSRT
jgi:hypothetical protein